MFNFKVFERTARVELGTIATIGGKGGKVSPLSRNLANTTKKVVLVITRKDGTSDTVTLSGPVSTLFRSKEISLAQICQFPVIEQPLTFIENGVRIPSMDANDKQRIANLVVMPSREGTALTAYELDAMPKAEYQPEENASVNYESLIALGF
jgi:hypothetical protein